MRRSCSRPAFALDEAVLHLDRAACGVDHAAELDEAAVASRLHDAPVVHGVGRIDQDAAQRPEPGERPIFASAGESVVDDNICDQNHGAHVNRTLRIAAVDVAAKWRAEIRHEFRRAETLRTQSGNLSWESVQAIPAEPLPVAVPWRARLKPP